MGVVDFLVSLAIGVLAGLGVGSGGLLTVYLTLVRDVPQKEAQAANLLFFTVALAAAAIVHFRRIRISPILLLITVPAAVTGALLGSALADVADPAFLRRLFGWFLIFASASSLASLTKKPLTKSRKNDIM